MDSERLLELIEQVQASGKIKKGINEVTKFLERGTAKIVIAASDVSPKEIIMHLPLLAKEKGIAYAEVAKREELGAAAALARPTAAIAILDGGNAKDMLNAIIKELTASAPAKEEASPKEEKAPAKKEEAKEKKPSKEDAKEVKEKEPVKEDKE